MKNLGENRRFFSPKNAARAIGVSESSLKRWCDKGLLRFRKTAGGHRRIETSEIVRFSLEKNHPIVRPDALGLPMRMPMSFDSKDELVIHLVKVLLSADEENARQIVLNQFMDGKSPSWIVDEIFSSALKLIGDKWSCNEIDVYQERIGCEIFLKIGYELLGLVSEPPQGALMAIGGSLNGDHYQLPTLSVEIGLRSAGWNAKSIGSNLPAASIVQATQNFRPRIAWLSISHTDDVDKTRDEVNFIYDSLPPSTSLVIGGYAVTAELKDQMRFTACCDSIQQLVEFLQPMNRIRPILQPAHEAENLNSQPFGN